MKKKIILLGVLLALLTSCVQKTPDEDKEEPAKQEEVVTGQSDNTVEADDTEEKPATTNEISPDQAEPEHREISIYSIGEDGSLQSKKVDWTVGDDSAIWRELRAANILSSDCLLNTRVVDEEQKTIDIDVNRGFGEYIRGFGTAGEQEILACVVNTYLEAYQCEKLKITEEKEVLQTGHRELDSYMGIQTL